MQTAPSTNPQSTQIADILKSRMAFIEIDADTKLALKEYLPALKTALPGILKDFYAHVASWPNLAQMFASTERMDYAREAQTKHWMQLFSANFDESYAASVRSIGRIHSHIGLEPTWYIGAYAFTLNRLYAHAVGQYQSRLSPDGAQKKTARLIRALNQCIMIDMDMAITVYLEENKRSYDKKLSGLAQSFEATIGAIVNSVSSASTQLEASAETLATMASQTSSGAETVAIASKEASANVCVVSSATEEMSASIAHVAEMAQRSFLAADQAAHETNQSVTNMGELIQAIDKVGEVTNLISDIAEQTNLLALNATIEAARAGEAGKGFAVVANEVKSLASETARATEDIKHQVAGIISKSNSAATSLETVKAVIGDSKTVSHETAQAVDQQKEAIREIALNVEQASAGTNEISKNITNISEGSDGVNTAAENILGAARELARQSVSLRNAVAHFIADLKTSG